MATATDEDDGYPLTRKRAALWVLPFLALGIIDLVLLLGWGLKPLWGFLIFPPIAFVSVLCYLALRTGLASNRLDE
jgi:hypothetical protein